ncbi:hypothetical protein SRB17_53260 [Streptomyces sp. RB17]|uniref:hypothetical protein n=1 Tax=Streptomyces sp. RB17 TaxID=2585197 RepID=UPI00130A45F7|nr:hypothetical protein [Streptomyces sp. RB17]
MAEQKSSSVLTAPLRGAASALRRVPGAGVVSRAAEETLDKVGALSPRGRRIAVYAGAGVLGAAGVVEWPVALTGAAVAWLTQPRPAHPADGGNGGGRSPEPAHDLGTAALRSGHGGGSRGAHGTGRAKAAAEDETSGGAWDAGAAEAGVEAAGAAEASGAAAASGESRTAGHTGTHGSGRSAGGTRPHGGGQTAGGTGTHGSGRSAGGTGASGSAGRAGSTKTSGSTRTTRGAESAVGKPSTGPLGPTARPDRTTL